MKNNFEIKLAFKLALIHFNDDKAGLYLVKLVNDKCVDIYSTTGHLFQLMKINFIDRAYEEMMILLEMHFPSFKLATDITTEVNRCYNELHFASHDYRTMKKYDFLPIISANVVEGVL